MDVSIIICTRDRAADLRQTLDSLARVKVLPALEAELVLVDNGSTDDTRQVARAFDAAHLPSRYFFEPRPGKARANATGLRHARGDVLLFTDDDVRVPSDWVEGMSAPIRSGEADAVAGGVVLAPHLQRPWMTPKNTEILATTAGVDRERPGRIVGANMAFARHVLEKVPAFDPELGVGAEIGTGEETLFSLQLWQAGFTVVSAFDTSVEHHCASERLSPTAYRKAWKRIGRSEAYIDYHWRHAPSNRLRTCAALMFKWAKLAGKHLLRRVAGPQLPDEGLPAWESNLLRERAYHRQLLMECRRPRNYVRHGLVKKSGKRPSAFARSGLRAR